MAGEKYKDVRLNKRDEMIGRFLSREINKLEEKTACPSMEDIAAFIDGRLGQEEKEKIMSHLSSCGECYEIFLETVKTQEEMAQQSRAKIKRILYYSVPAAAIAAAAVLLIVFKLVIQKPFEQAPVVAKHEEIKTEIPKQETKEVTKGEQKPESEVIRKYTPPSASDMVKMIAKNTDLKLLTNSFREQPQVAYGFSENRSIEKTFFRTGVYLTDLEVALRAGERDKSLDIIKKTRELLEKIKGSEKLIAFYDGMKQKIEEGKSIEQFAGSSRQAEGLIKDKNVILYLKFGEWVEGGRLAAIAHDEDFYNVDQVRYFEGKSLPEKVMRSLKEIENNIDKENLIQEEFKQMERLFKDLIDNL